MCAREFLWCTSNTDGESVAELQRRHTYQLKSSRTRRQDARRQLADLHAFRRGEQQLNRDGYSWFAIADECASHPITAGSHDTLDDVAQWCAHEARWVAFEAMPPQVITAADVPWPPSAAVLLRWLATAAQQEHTAAQAAPQHHTRHPHCQEASSPAIGQTAGCTARAASERERSRAAYLIASRRWHPDKFEARFGHRLAAADRTAVMDAVQTLMQGINKVADAQIDG